MLILPKLAAMSDGQIWMVEDFVWCGGSVVYTGVTGMLDEWSEARSCFPLDELFGTAAATWPPLCVSSGALARVVSSTPCIQEPDHPILRWFADADILLFGEEFYEVASDRPKTLATFVPPS